MDYGVLALVGAESFVEVQRGTTPESAEAIKHQVNRLCLYKSLSGLFVNKEHLKKKKLKKH